jgi:serine/threonine-protein kinase
VDGIALLPIHDVAPAADPDDHRVGQVLGARYQVRRIVADGGMGRVYEALDIQSNRRVALKVLHAAVALDRVSLERFKREYEVSKLLPHEHIAEVYDFLRLPDGSYVLSMEFLEGEELRALLKRNQTVRPARVVRMLSQVAIGLDEAHRRQLIHRDIKPENIFLCGTQDGDLVKLLDFGSVKDKSEGAKKLTVMGTTIGSPFYMSPEQAQGLDSLDARADVWALAAVSYESLTGNVPFEGKNGPSILIAILTQVAKPPSRIARECNSPYPIPTTVDAALEHAFAKDPTTRIPSVGALADQLGQAYGLEGSHRDWAYVPEQQVQDRIDAALPSLMQQSTAMVEADPFGTPEKDPFAVPQHQQPISPQPEMNTQQLQAMLTPKGPPITLIVAALVFVLVLLVGITIGIVIWLR